MLYQCANQIGTIGGLRGLQRSCTSIYTDASAYNRYSKINDTNFNHNFVCHFSLARILRKII